MERKREDVAGTVADPADVDKALAAFSHPNIVTIHDFGQAGGFTSLRVPRTLAPYITCAREANSLSEDSPRKIFETGGVAPFASLRVIKLRFYQWQVAGSA